MQLQVLCSNCLNNPEASHCVCISDSFLPCVLKAYSGVCKQLLHNQILINTSQTIADVSQGKYEIIFRHQAKTSLAESNHSERAMYFQANLFRLQTWKKTGCTPNCNCILFDCTLIQQCIISVSIWIYLTMMCLI